MTTPTTCPVCNRAHDVPPKYIGKMWRCPACRSRFRVGGDAEGKTLEPAPWSASLRRALEWIVAALVGAAIATWWFHR